MVDNGFRIKSVPTSGMFGSARQAGAYPERLRPATARIGNFVIRPCPGGGHQAPAEGTAKAIGLPPPACREVLQAWKRQKRPYDVLVIGKGREGRRVRRALSRPHSPATRRVESAFSNALMGDFPMITRAGIAMLLCAAARQRPCRRLCAVQPDIKPKATIKAAQVFNGFGCTGENISPALGVEEPAQGTKSFALQVRPGRPDRRQRLGGTGSSSTFRRPPANCPRVPAGIDGSRRRRAPYKSTPTSAAPAGGPARRLATPASLQLHAARSRSRSSELPPGATAALAGYMINASSLGEAEADRALRPRNSRWQGLPRRRPALRQRPRLCPLTASLPSRPGAATASLMRSRYSALRTRASRLPAGHLARIPALKPSTTRPCAGWGSK